MIKQLIRCRLFIVCYMFGSEPVKLHRQSKPDKKSLIPSVYYLRAGPGESLCDSQAKRTTGESVRILPLVREEVR
jgi:hypothetical protein